MSTVPRCDYCQFLLVSHTNYILTYFVDHRSGFSPDAVKRYLEEEKLTVSWVLSTQLTDFIATNDMAQDSTQDTQDVGALRWKLEPFHRESKQTRLHASSTSFPGHQDALCVSPIAYSQ